MHVKRTHNTVTHTNANGNTNIEKKHCTDIIRHVLICKNKKTGMTVQAFRTV